MLSLECIRDLAVKQDYFQKLDALCPLSTVLTTNTSAISVTEIAGRLSIRSASSVPISIPPTSCQCW